MSEPTSSMNYAALYGQIVSSRSIDAAAAKGWLDLGYLKFLRAYNWSFTCPQATLIMTAGDTVTALPDNFAELIEGFSYPAQSGYRMRGQVSSQIILDKLAASSLTGTPIEYAIEPAAFVQSTGQRWQVRWFPVPDATTTLTYCYRIIPPKMSADADYPIGGPMHATTILYAALAEYEYLRGSVEGTYQKLYEAALADSVRLDQQITQGSNLGNPSQRQPGIRPGWVTPGLLQ